MSDALRALLSPRSIVIVGASADPNKVNGRPIRNLVRDGYRGRIYLVNPRYDEIAGIPCYPDIAALPEAPDLGVVGVAAQGAADVVAALGDKGVRSAIVWSSGFRETGPAGALLEDALRDTARRHGIRLCGPNTLGLTNAFERMPLTFSQYADTPLVPGPVAFVSQSGAFGTAVATAARDRGIGLGYFVSTGNQADITIASVVDEILDDERISVIVAYMEGLKDGQAFLATARKALALGKPLIVVKVGRRAAGSRAALSHTGSLAGDDAVFDSVIRQFGVLRARDEMHALDLTAALVAGPIPVADGGLGLITISGGAGAMMADLAEDVGMQVPVLVEATQARLSQVLRGFASTGNPVDVTGQVVEDVSIIGASLDAVLEDPQIAICVIWVQLLHAKSDQLAQLLIERRAVTRKPFVVCWLNAPAAAVKRLRESRVCVAETTLGGVQCAAGLDAYGRALRSRSRSSQSVVSRARDPGPRPSRPCEPVASIEAAALLERYGLDLAPARLAVSADDAERHARELGLPVAVKVESPDLPHKTEADGVRLGVTSPQAVRLAFDSVVAAARAYRPHARITGALVQRMAEPATELVLGLRRDPSFGPIIMVGLGGILVEVLADVAFGAPPLDQQAARQTIDRLRAQAVLRGVRGRPAVDLDRLASALCSLSRLACENPQVTELDLNPVFAGQQGIVAVDWLMIREVDG